MTRPKYLYAVEKRTREAIYNDGERHSKWDTPDSYGEWGEWELLTTNSSPSGFYLKLISAAYAAAQGGNGYYGEWVHTNELRVVRAFIGTWAEL